MRHAGPRLQRRRHSPEKLLQLPRWLVALVVSLLIPAYAIAAVVDPRPAVTPGASLDVAQALGAAADSLEAASAAASNAVDLTGEHSDCSDDAADHVADTVPPTLVRPAGQASVQLPQAPPRQRAIDTLLRPPSTRA